MGFNGIRIYCCQRSVFKGTHSFRSEVFHSPELVHGTPPASPSRSVIACLVEVTFLCHQLRSVRLRSENREGEREERGKGERGREREGEKEKEGREERGRGGMKEMKKVDGGREGKINQER